MAIQYDPRLQGKPNTTDILTGQEDLSQQPQDGSQAPPQATQPQSNAQAAQPQQNAPQSNLATNKPKSSSGMFTNVRQYVEKNQPATQQMAGAASKQFTNTSDIIKKQMGSALGKYSQSIGAKQKEVDQLRQAGRSQVDQIVNAPAPQQTIQPTPEMANQATGGVRTANVPTQQRIGNYNTNNMTEEERAQSLRDATKFQYMPTGKGPEGFNQDTMSQQTIMEGAEERFKNYEDSSRKNILDFWKNAKPGDERLVPIQDEWGRFTGTKVETITQEQIDNMLSGPKALGSAITGGNVGTQRPSDVQQQESSSPSFYELGQTAQEIGRGAKGLNLDAQISAAERLKQQADNVRSEQGRKQILRDVFGQNRQYSQGSQNLDNLLISASPEASENLIQGVRGAGRSAYDEVTQGSQQAADILKNLQFSSENLGQNLEDYRQQAITGLQSNINANREQFIADRQAAIQKEINDAIAGISSLQESQAGGAFKDLSSLAQALNPYTNRGYDFDSAFKAGAIRENLGRKMVTQPFGGNRMKTMYGDVIDYYSDRIKLDPDAFDQLARDYNLSDLGINLDDVRNKFFEGSKKAGTNRRSRRFKASSAQAALDMINERLGNINAEEFARQKLEKQYGTDLDTLLSGGDLQEGQYYSMDQNEVDRINKLKELQREQDLLQTRDYLDTDEVADFDAFDRIINKYK